MEAAQLHPVRVVGQQATGEATWGIAFRVTGSWGTLNAEWLLSVQASHKRVESLTTSVVGKCTKTILSI